ncbi:unnamed protein product [Meganyctiphanes norvegica]|uniref:Spaetzle domain-containing protein n=1 Tax=Meganyctiphanes norvegica TaxID=48144 RepID=A0AAV2QUW4_MEGNR
MAMRLLVSLAIVALASADVGSHVSISHGAQPAVTYSAHRPHHVPSYHPAPAYHQRPTYHHQPAAYKPAHAYEADPPACSVNTTKTWCLEDDEYPTYELKAAIDYHFKSFKNLYADVADLNTELSVERPTTLEEETYLCPSETAYIRPLRAINTEGKWRVIINNIKAHYESETLTQTTRIEECLTSGNACPLVPVCYGSKCLQKSIYHRFVVYNPYDQYFPFAMETFQLPASCACLLSAFTIDH